MLSKIRIKNFKSFHDSGDMHISPITLILGENSSGKSTIIQSLLIIKQTIESPYSNEAIIVNGAYTSVGDLTDVIHHSKKNLSETFEFNFDLNYEFDKKIKFIDQHIWASPSDIKFDEITLSLEIGKANQSLPKVIHSTIRGRINNQEFSFSSFVDPSIKENLHRSFNTEEITPLLGTNLYGAKVNNLRIKIAGVLLNKFFPDIMIIENENKIQQLSRRTLEILLSYLINKDPHAQRLKDATYSSKIVHLLRKNKQQTFFTRETSGPFSESIKTIISHANPIKEDAQYESERWATILELVGNDDKLFFEKQLNSTIAEIDRNKTEKKELIAKKVWNVAIENEEKKNFDACINTFKESFKRIYYLGPLREEPKVFYSRLGSNDPMYVGQKGENLAFVLKYYSKRQIFASVPPEIENEVWNPYDPSLIKPILLQDAVIKWLKYIGIAKNISVNEMGKIGLTINANIYGQKETDLLNVGVGVSQVLPLIVLGLASPVICTLILEQPELHLHPFVQSRLGDFFVSLAACGKQVIAETHSEHLINRMRYLVAKRFISNNTDLSIYFTQRNNETESSEIVNVNIDKYGSIEHWPEGFCDETEKQLAAILKASFEND